MFLKTTTEGRQRAKQKSIEEKLLRDRQNELDEEKRLYVFMIYNIFSYRCIEFFMEAFMDISSVPSLESS